MLTCCTPEHMRKLAYRKHHYQETEIRRPFQASQRCQKNRDGEHPSRTSSGSTDVEGDPVHWKHVGREL